MNKTSDRVAALWSTQSVCGGPLQTIINEGIDVLVALVRRSQVTTE